MDRDRIKGFSYIFIVYLLGTAIGIFTFRFFDASNPFLRIAAADAAATLAVWAGGLAARNSSVYDPFWSVAPIVIFTLYAIHSAGYTVPALMALLCVWLWGIRLTANWAYTFSGLKTQDWRYDKYKNDLPKLWFLVNLFGINLMPTAIVFLAMLPGLVLIGGDYSANPYTAAAMVLCVSAAGLQFLSDQTMHRFRMAALPGEVCDKGLWKYSRHPNYLGEILMWWGIFIMLISVDISYWPTGIGAFANTLLFLFISIPLMEGRQLSDKPGYDEYMRRTSMLLPMTPAAHSRLRRLVDSSNLTKKT
ncbi:MAG: DUF1295 domain-containing protein [Saccharofermentanales bacterium]